MSTTFGYTAEEGEMEQSGARRNMTASRTNSRNSSSQHLQQQQQRGTTTTTTYDNQNADGGEGEYTLAEDNPAALEPTQSDESTEVYYVKQRRGYCAIGFSVVQTLVLAIMMWQCGVAPLNVNPMVGPYPDTLNVSASADL